jgi:uncharacterized damage-inducible protein DinB
MTSDAILTLWQEARTRFSAQLPLLTPEDLPKKMAGAPNSVGFLLRHIAEVELLFAKNVFGLPDVSVLARTVIDKRDTGEWTDLPALLSLQEYAAQCLEAAIRSQTDWPGTVTTREFGTRTRLEALGRIVSHTAYHAGQMAMILRYGMEPK